MTITADELSEQTLQATHSGPKAHWSGGHGKAQTLARRLTEAHLFLCMCCLNVSPYARTQGNISTFRGEWQPGPLSEY